MRTRLLISCAFIACFAAENVQAKPEAKPRAHEERAPATPARSREPKVTTHGSDAPEGAVSRRDRNGRSARSRRARLRRLIRPWLGTPYKFGEAEKGEAADCSGFVGQLYQEGFAIDLPRTSAEQFQCGTPVSIGSLQPGDLLFFDIRRLGRPSHVGVYLGSGRFVHASPTQGVSYANFGQLGYRRSFRGARRILADERGEVGGSREWPCPSGQIAQR